MADMLKNVKTMLSITDNKQDDILKNIINNTEQRLLVKLPEYENEVPSKLSFIVEEVAIKRFNRIGAEGMSTESVDGRTNTFINGDFDEYLDDIERLYPSETNSKRGMGTFY
ncbi:phage head-tail connector protein [Staphylococcus ureilyticus]|uniref:phage head-tail connector protein n=1 Tax=Staphylococcus ureilyticus TaxID=94138 RepID=UPI00321B9B15